MNQIALIRNEDGILKVSGSLDAYTVVDCLAKSKPLLKNGKELRIDLQSVTRSDSAGLALLAEWVRYAKTHQVTVRFIHMPPQMLAMAKLSGLDKILPIE